MALRIKKKGLDDTIRTLESLRNPVDKRTAKSAANAAVKEMKKLISGGKSPIAGISFDKLTKKYADSKKRGNRKPNLKLSGKFLKSLQGRAAKIGKAWVSRISYTTSLSKDKERWHREAKSSRPTIPEDGEKFKRSVIDAYMKVIRAGIKRRKK